MPNGPQATRKYRPVLTAGQITKILELAKLESPMSDISFSLISTLAPFKAKIENLSITAAYTASPPKREQILSDLGGSGSGVIDIIPSEHFSKEEYWAKCYAKHCLQPASCSLEEIVAASEHKYLNGLMTESEVVSFEEGKL